jgi:hypothetical protein
MYKQILLILVFLSPVLRAFSQETQMDEVIYDTLAKQEILIGNCDLAGLNSPVFGSYFKDEYNRYSEDPAVAAKIAARLRDVSFVVIMGTWCGDSREQVGRFYRILDNAGYPTSAIRLICVDKHKKAGPVDMSSFVIEKVPTFIVYKYGDMMGRIVETPRETLEKDLLQILEVNPAELLQK